MPCEKWSDVMAFHNRLFAGYNQFFFPEEYEDHNQCRWIPLNIYERHPSVNMNNASAHHYVNTEGWTRGPWCYVKLGDECQRINRDNETVNCTSLWAGNFSSPYEPRPCFAPCDYRHIAERTTPDKSETPLKEERHLSNFNEKLIEHLNDELFSSVSWGDMSYYSYLPSKQQLSASFIARRHYLLTTCVSILVFILLLFFGTYAWRRMRARQRKQRTRAEDDAVRTAIETESVPQ
ncbi:hypothetical protein AAVH_03481 [Aphelenchoides avenae]|nr:hypothetical protein AAVH_03481 [Aphelenchus avenae]